MSPKPLEIGERFRFYKRNQRERESILSYVTELRKLATHCNFGGNLNEALRDRLVCGLRNMQIQKRLLSEAKLKYSKAVEITVAMETAIRDASELQSELNLVPHVDKLTESNKTTRAKPAATPYCYRCGGNTHMAHSCFYKDQTCHHCENRAISSEFVVLNSKASLNKQPKTQRYMLLRLMLQLMLMKTSLPPSRCTM